MINETIDSNSALASEAEQPKAKRKPGKQAEATKKPAKKTASKSRPNL